MESYQEKANDIRNYYYTELRTETELTAKECLSLSKKLTLIALDEIIKSVEKEETKLFYNSAKIFLITL